MLNFSKRFSVNNFVSRMVWCVFNKNPVLFKSCFPFFLCSIVLRKRLNSVEMSSLESRRGRDSSRWRRRLSPIKCAAFAMRWVCLLLCESNAKQQCLIQTVNGYCIAGKFRQEFIIYFCRFRQSKFLTKFLTKFSHNHKCGIRNVHECEDKR